MKTRLWSVILALTCAFALTSRVLAHEGHDKDPEAATEKSAAKGELVKVDAKTDPKWLAKETVDYPGMCFVSDDKLGEHGDPQDYIYRVAGKPDRLIRFCCNDCVKDFKENPDKFLKMIDQAKAAAKTKSGS